MAKNRYIDTRFWHDTYIRESLNPLDRYLFLYFLTNDKTNICGIYENSISTIASETGIEKDMLIKMLKRLDGKIYYIDGWVYIKNFIKYQNQGSPSVKKGIEEEMKRIPDDIKNKIGSIDHIETVSHLNPNPNPNPNSNPKEVSILDTRFSDIVALYFKLYEDKYKNKPLFGAAEGRFVNMLLSKQEYCIIQNKLNSYFNNTDLWFTKTGHDFKQFYSHYNEIVDNKKINIDSTKKQTQEDMKSVGLAGIKIYNAEEL